MATNQIQVRNPSLTLYAFHLRNDITKGPQEVQSDAAALWEKLEQLAKFLQADELVSLRDCLICFKDGKSIVSRLEGVWFEHGDRSKRAQSLNLPPAAPVFATQPYCGLLEKFLDRWVTTPIMFH